MANTIFWKKLQRKNDKGGEKTDGIPVIDIFFNKCKN